MRVTFADKIYSIAGDNLTRDERYPLRMRITDNFCGQDLQKSERHLLRTRY
jgi:hypothetical protein